MSIIVREVRNKFYFTLAALKEVGFNAILTEMNKDREDYPFVVPEPLHWLIDAMRVTYTDPTIYFEMHRSERIRVLQAGMLMGSLSVYKPNGGSRDSLQAEVCSSKIQNRKSPTDVKRSSTRAKAEKLVNLLAFRSPLDYSKHQLDQTNYNFNDIINKSVPVDLRKLNDFAQGLYYSDRHDFLARLMRGQINAVDQPEIDDYLTTYDTVQEQRMERNLLEVVRVVLQALPPGGKYLYRMTTYVQDPTAARPEGYVSTIRDFPNMESLPEVVQSKLALLQLGSGSSAKMVGFRGDADCSWLPRYGFIGEDLGELIDTGGESKEGGNSLSE
jgi:hypothetical protein